ncbi:MAG: putative blue copper protein [Deltaproteobacteria bacterium]|nr:putative blue copper protein [Deltaproteobacteria bacterium]
MQKGIRILLLLSLSHLGIFASSGFCESDVIEVDCASTNPASIVSIKEYAFEPTIATIKAGEVIKWVNDGSSSHMITSGNPGDKDAGSVFALGFITPKKIKCLQFQKPGSYIYHCRPHGNLMKGASVIVE